MTDVQTLPKSPSRATASARPAGDNKPTALSQELFRQIGETLNGTHWQSDVARNLGISKSQVTRYLDTSGNPRTSRTLTPMITDQLHHIIVNRIGELTALLSLPGMPYAGDAKVAEVVRTIAKALQAVPARGARSRS